MGNQSSKPPLIDSSSTAATSECPVDHGTRSSTPKCPNSSGLDAQSTQVCPVDPATREKWIAKAADVPSEKSSTLSNTRTISSIPRADIITKTSTSSTPAASHASPNYETAAPLTSTEGNWIYPSESQFYRSLVLKHSSSAPSPDLIHTMLPIHNAVNERVWSLIRQWELPYVQDGKCLCGSKLVQFKGESGKLTPRARWNVWVRGRKAPFDRHDWVVDRCGQKVEYVIDFYEGRGSGLNFYIDCRPKLNTWEGWKMRAARYWGIVEEGELGRTGTGVAELKKSRKSSN